jgi:hypothetical protein
MKVRCNHAGCGWQGVDDPSHTKPDPESPGDEIAVCPECKSVDTLIVVCDEPGCWEPVAVGSDRWGCVAHIPRNVFDRNPVYYKSVGFGVSSYVPLRLAGDDK